MLRSLVAPAEVVLQSESHAEAPTEIKLRRNLSKASLETALAEGAVVWIDAVNPDAEDLKWLEEQFHLHPAVMGDLARDDRRPMLRAYPDYLFLSLFQPTVKQTTVTGDEIHCLIGVNWLLTVRKESASAVEGAYDRVAANTDYWLRGLAYLLYMVIQTVVDSYYPLLDRLSNQLNSLEEKAMSDGDRSLQRSVFRIKQQLINLRQMVAPQREVISNMIGEERITASPDDRDLFRHLYERLLRIYDVIDAQRDLASNVLDLIENQEASNLAKAVSRLTVLSMIFLPPTFIVGLFGLNFVTTSPEFEIPMSGAAVFVFIVAVTLAMSFGIAWFFRRQGWL
ncbi:MAG: magnesium transporter CorA family protein [bacterium]|nr:magnesium transporter CorA family protein [bacterium]